jgi:branched-chain amino acid transport system permease protein
MLSKWHIIIISITLGALALVPPLAEWLDEPFYTSMFARIMIFAIAAVSLDLILGFGGMVSFGHAAYLGTGGYAVAIFSFYGIDNGFLQCAAAILGSGLIALIIGAISLRTSGVYFIMITLAFTQMLFFLGISLEEYGGDDGINTNRSEFFETLNLNDDFILYYFILGSLVLFVFLCYRFVHARFGMVIRGSHANDARMQAIGFSTYRYKLAAFVISGAMCGFAGLLLANLTEFVTPEYMNWFRSGEIMIMVLMGGMGTVFGPILGAAAFILLEDFIPDLLNLLGAALQPLFGDVSNLGQHWPIIFGPFLVVLVLFAKRGMWGLIPGRKP